MTEEVTRADWERAFDFGKAVGGVDTSLLAEYFRRHRIANQPPAQDGLVDLLKQARNVLAGSGAESGYCMCGDPVQSHSLGSGHAPVDSHAYYAGRLVEQIDAALASLGDKP